MKCILFKKGSITQLSRVSEQKLTAQTKKLSPNKNETPHTSIANLNK